MASIGKTVRSVSKQVYYLTVAVCIVLLILLFATTWLSNAVSERKNEAAQWLSQQVGYPVTIGEAELYVFDFFPKLHLRNVHILDSKKKVSVMSINHIYLDIDLVKSIQQQQAILNTMSLTEASLQVRRTDQGTINIQGLDKLLKQQNKSQSDAFTLPVQAVDVRQLAVKYSDDMEPTLNGDYILDNGAFSLDDTNQLSVRANALLPRHLGQQLHFNGNFQFATDNTSLEVWRGQINANNLSVTSWAELADLNEFKLGRGVANVNVELSQDSTKAIQVKGQVSLENIAISSTHQEQQPVIINQLSTVLVSSWNEEQWSIKTDSLRLNIDKQQWPDTELALVATKDRYQLQMDYLNIADLTNVVKKLTYEQYLAELQPEGEITELDVDYSIQNGVNSFSANLKQLAFTSTENIPGVNGLTAKVKWDGAAGFITFDSSNLIVDASSKLPEKITLAQLKGKASLEKREQHWKVALEQLFVKNDDLTLTINGLVSHSEQATIPDLHIDLENIQVAKWKNYVPAESLSDDFRTWSDQAFRAGLINKGSVDLSGNLAEFPFLKPEQQGEFKMELAVTDVQLDYGIDWPHLYHVDGIIVGDGKLLAIESQKGRIADFAFNKLRTEIDNYLVSKPVLTTKGRIDGTTQKALDFLKNSPLKDRFGQLATSFTATGDTSIVLDLTVPLTDVNAASANGSVSFKNSQLISDEDVGIQLDSVNGILLFDGDGVSADKLSAQFLGLPVLIDVLPAKDSTLIEATGEMSIAKLFKKWPELNSDFISGKTPFKTTVSVVEKQRGIFDLDVTVLSDLQGVVIDTPAPFGKTAEQARQLSVAIHEHKKNVLAYQLNYADVLSTYLLAENESMFGEIRLGSGKAKLAESGLSLKGQLGQVNVTSWQQWLNKQPTQEGAGLIQSLDVISLNIDELRLANQSATNMAVVAEKAAQEWRVNVQSDQIKGRVNWPLNEHNDLPLIIDLDYLYLKTINTEADVNDTKTKSSSSLWPSTRFTTKRLHIDQMKLGAVSLSSRNIQNQWIIDSLKINSDSYQAEAQGVWSKDQGIDETQFKLKANSKDLKAVLSDFGYQQAIQAKATELELDVNWLGMPTDLSLATVDGTFKLKVGSGKLIDVEPGAAGRIFGLMSITAIPRRLTLDFSDLFKKGFNFSAINGEFKLEDGIAYTSDLVMAGDAARIEVKGPIDLVDKRYNQSVKVIPNVSSTLPVAGAVAGGPVGLGVGAAILLVDKIADNLFGKEIVNLVSYNYSLTGPWSEPELTTLKAVTE